jgi:ArsR family transcriptional regulator, arsenate/arsenite/antimonite-responsive transcriptional repressor
LTPADATELARAFKALGDPVRLRLLSLIGSVPEGEICVCELIEPFNLAGPTMSHHLKVLRQAGLIEGERRGTWIYYRVVPTALARLSTLLDTTATLDPASLSN